MFPFLSGPNVFDNLSPLSPQCRHISGGHLSPSFCSISRIFASISAKRLGRERIILHSSQRSRVFIMSSSIPTTELHNWGLIRTSPRLSRVNVTPMKGGAIGLLVENDDDFQSIILTENEALHLSPHGFFRIRQSLRASCLGVLGFTSLSIHQTPSSCPFDGIHRPFCIGNTKA